MTVTDWLTAAVRDARARGLADLEPLLNGLARSTTVLREADDVRRRRAGGETDGGQAERAER
jgi:hypothetical protein